MPAATVGGKAGELPGHALPAQVMREDADPALLVVVRFPWMTADRGNNCRAWHGDC
jgi:hypothetical protein